MNAEDFRAACGNFDISRCSSLLESLSAEDAELIPQIIEENVRESGCLIQPRPKKGSEHVKRKFIEYCRNKIGQDGDTELTAKFEKHLNEAEILQSGYHEILKSLKNSEAGKLTPAQQVWSSLERAVSEIKVLESQLEQTAASHQGFVDPVRAKVKRENSSDIDPDSVVNTVTNVLGSTILMLAYENGWIKSQQLRLPDRQSVSEQMRFQAGTTAYLGMLWRGLKHSDDRLRYFGGTVTRRKVEAIDENKKSHSVEALVFESSLQVAEIEEIAHERLLRAQFGFFTELEYESNSSEKVSGAESGVPLPPSGFISSDELLAFITLGDLFCYPVESETLIYNGLALKHWLRGYAVVKEKFAHKNGSPLFELRSFDSLELEELLTRFGLSSDQATAFVNALIFTPSRNDLFNTPFLRCHGTELHFYAPAYMAANLTEIIVSRLAAEGVQFQTKGKLFETKILNLLNLHGRNAKGFKYSLGGQEFDCDAAFVWDDTLFVFECKNYGLSGLNITSSYRFLQKMQSAAGQVKRICRQLNENPEIVRGHLGGDVSWSKTVPCVINAMPWAAGKLAEVYFYDSSALTKFFDEGFIAVVTPIKLRDNVIVQRRHKISMWDEEKPTAKDFLRQLEDPIQVRSLEDEWEVDAPLAMFSEKLGFVSPFLRRKTPNIERSLKAFGMNDHEIAELLKDFAEMHIEAQSVKAKTQNKK